MVTSAADLGDLQTKPNNAYLSLHDIPFWKSHTKDNAMVTADLCDLQTKPNNAYLPLHDIPFWKCQIKDNAIMTCAADLGDL